MDEIFTQTFSGMVKIFTQTFSGSMFAQTIAQHIPWLVLYNPDQSQTKIGKPGLFPDLTQTINGQQFFNPDQFQSASRPNPDYIRTKPGKKEW